MAGATMDVPSSKRIQSQGIPTYYRAPGTLVIVFFFLAFIAARNSFFIPFCKNYFNLDQFQSQLIDFVFSVLIISTRMFFAYGSFSDRDLVGKLGYEGSTVYG
jgi:FHS family L-fucose permease-like MFS transporter